MNLEAFGGIKILADGETDVEKQRKIAEEQKKFFQIDQKSEGYYREQLVKKGMVPPFYKDATFDADHIRENIRIMSKKSGARFMVDRANFDKYASMCNGIVSAIRSNKLPDSSYLLGAPNGFGKTSLATDIVVASFANGWLTVPYTSLTELAELRLANERRLLTGMRTRSNEYERGEIECIDGVYQSVYNFNFDEPDYIKKPVYITGRFSWSEYMNAPIVVCYFTSIENKVVESNILATILSIRATKGYPTIVMVSTAMDPYVNDPKLKRLIWDEILSYDETINTYDRLHHISCYKRYTTVFQNDMAGEGKGHRPVGKG